MDTETRDNDTFDYLKYNFITIENIVSLFPDKFFENFDMDYDDEDDFELDDITGEYIKIYNGTNVATDLVFYFSIPLFNQREYYIGCRIMTPRTMWMNEEYYHSHTRVIFLIGTTDKLHSNLDLEEMDFIIDITSANQVIDLLNEEWPSYVDQATAKIVAHCQKLVNSDRDLEIDQINGYFIVNEYLAEYMNSVRDSIIRFEKAKEK